MVQLSNQEQAWLDAHPVIRVVQDPGWPPIEYIDAEGNFAGMTMDYLDLIENRLGIKFTLCPVESWQEAYAGLLNRDFDMTTSVSPSRERLEFLNFTLPYMKIPVSILTNTDRIYISSMKELNGRKVASVKDYSVTGWIRRDYPEIDLIEVASSKEGLELLQKNKIFGFIENMLVTSHYIARMQLTNIKIAGETPYVNIQSMAVRKDWPTLSGILQKTLETITEQEHDEIYFKWVPIRYEAGVDYSLLWKAIAVSSILLLLSAAWIIRLRNEILTRKKAELDRAQSDYQLRSHLENTPLGVVQWDLNFKVTDWNPAAEKIFGYARKEVIGEDINIIVPEYLRNQIESLFINISGNRVSGQESRISINDNRTKTGKIITCEWLNTPISSITGKKIGIAALCRDITAELLSKEQLKTSLDEKNVLLRELYHRTKNNMQLISAFLTLESQLYENDSVDALVESVNSRIQTIALVHEKLCQSKNLAKLNIKEYIEEIVLLIQSCQVQGSRNISFNSEIEDIDFSIDNAVPLGIVINEIVTNTFKHAFPDKREGSLYIQLLEEEAGIIILKISDNGVGFSKDAQEARSTFGMMTIKNIIEMQLNGKIELSTAKGVSYTISMNLCNDQVRV